LIADTTSRELEKLWFWQKPRTIQVRKSGVLRELDIGSNERDLEGERLPLKILQGSSFQKQCA
jgi:hypothetical protein